MEKYVNIYKVIIVLIIVAIVGVCGTYKFGISPVSKENKEVIFEVTENSTFLTIANELKTNNLIRSANVYKIYIKIFKPEGLQKGKYVLNENMGVEKIVETLSQGSTYNPDTITITFKEGIHMRKIASTIAENTNNSEQDVYDLLNDSQYLDSLINKYWFIKSDIKKEGIYYSLEGYLFPDTYEYLNKDVTVKDIFEKMLNRMDSVLSKYKTQLENSKYSIHEILTLASIVELEAANSDDRNGVAGVFYNRLEDGWALGSDVTTYYAEKLDMNERDLKQSELDEVNDYNTRSDSMAGKLPISPICIPSEKAIEAALNPTSHKYYYFVADKNKKTYFNETYSGHNNTITTLKQEGLWFVY